MQMNAGQNYYVRICSAGTSNCDESNAPFYITQNATTNAVQLYSLQPAQGAPGTTITVNGAGFTSDSRIVFDGQYQTGATMINSNTLAFQVPDYVGQYCAPGMACTAIAYQLPGGMHSLAVDNANGRSNSLQFTLYR
jgi:hypothetical protein